MAEQERVNIVYACVASSEQRDKLESQKRAMARHFPNFQLLEDFGSGLDFTRPSFLRLMGLVLQGKVKYIAIYNKSTLARFGYELIEYVCEKNGTTIISGEPTQPRNADKVLVDDFCDILNNFGNKFNARRR